MDFLNMRLGDEIQYIGTSSTKTYDGNTLRF
jgi:hypothetical protein